MVKKGDDVTLTCSVSGDPPLSITWTRDKQPLNLETEPRFQVSQTASGDSRMKSVLRVTSVGRVDSALYTCLASNMYGQDDTNIQLIVQGNKKVGSFQVTIPLYPTEQPDAPREVQISETGSRLVRLSWEPPFSGNSLITKYILHIRENGSASSQSRNISVPGTNTSADISDLRPSTGYDVYLIAENAIGPSGAGRTFHFKTEEEVPDGPPTAVKAEAIGPDALRISWEINGFTEKHPNKMHPQSFPSHCLTKVEKAAKYAEAQMLRGFVRFPEVFPLAFVEKQMSRKRSKFQWIVKRFHCYETSRNYFS
ncbi:down syndrome cell adhesion molecule-like protein Dscam2 [Caerostris darwini]|uniref:Down syndrome cell adhesion molecule-like protein Dscam2 n=1 Tax=Caerostris darwini TaxID=1538125 RepID=A0AAV4QPE2_9ARAC|nr:down syndrome cell adhesion molecule-like protein Dscam2 [Caerostris darwini]